MRARGEPGPTGDPRFELLGELGSGGMGVVYRARDRERGGVVALKALREVGPAEVLRLKREFRAMCDVRHPNLVRLGELFERDRRWFFTMELVEGVDFLAWVGAPTATPEPASAPFETGRATVAEPLAAAAVAADRDVTRTLTDPAPIAHAAPPRPPPEAMRPTPAFDEARLREALRGVTEGLAGLHRAGIVHRDIKPSNIKVDPGGRVVLLDFGVAAAVHEVDADVAGTFAYMAPEHAAGQATPASDWYAVGVMLFRAMTGLLPFPSSRDALAVKATVPAPCPDQYVRDLPRDLVGLCRGLLLADPAARAGEAEVRAVVSPGLPLRAPTPAIVPFVGRAPERARLAEIRERQRGGGACHVVAIVGPSGVGKTALARRFLDDVAATEPLLVLEGRCDERETVPFNALDGVVDALARMVARRADELPEAARAALQGRDAVELCRLFPVLAGVAPDAAPRRRVDDPRAAAAAALRGVLDALARRRPLAILIDDAQWADADSGALLADLLAPPAPPLLLVVTARGPGAPPLVAGLRVPVDAIALGGLDEADAVELAAAVAGRARVDAAAIAREADGHPMYIAELSRFAAEHRARAGSLDDALWARACDAAPAARRLLHVVVTDGAALPLPVAVAAAGLAPEEAAAAIAELRAGRFLRAGDEIVEPYHDRVREALAGRLPRAEQAALHLALAGALEASGAPPERLAHHWAGGGERERASRCAEAAAARAGGALAFERAAEWLAMALSLGGGVDDARRRALLVAHGEALTLAGHSRDAGLAFLEASRTGEPPELEQRDLRRRAAERLLVGGYVIEGVEVARELLAEVGLPWPATRGAALRALLWEHALLGLRRMRWRRRGEAELPAEERLRLDTCWSAAIGLSMVDSIRGATFALRLPRMTFAAGEPHRIALALSAAAFAAAGMNQRRRLRRLTAAIARAAAETDAPQARCYVTLAEAARAYFFDNDWGGTLDLARRGLAAWAEAGGGHTWEVDLFEQFIGWAHLTAGDYDQTADHAERVLRGARRRGDRFLEVGFRVQFPHQYLLSDRPADGVLDVDDALASWPVTEGVDPISNQFYWAWRARTMLALYAGRAEAEADAIGEAWRRVEQSLLWRVPAVRLDVSVWSGAWTLQRAAEAAPGGAARRAHLAEARRRMRTIAASPLPSRAWVLQMFRGVIAHLEGDAAAAIDALRTAIPMLDAGGMPGPATATRWRLGQLLGGDEGTALVDEARGRLRALGALRPDRMIAFALAGFAE